VDFLARQFRAEVVVRYCGGSQAGHNVQLPDGSRHTFSQFGAGTLAGAKTYLGPRMILSPGTLPPEAEHLESLGVTDPMSLLTAHPDSLVSTWYHMLMNRLREMARGKNRHGSCGLGIGETRHYWLRYGQDAIVASDLRDRRTLNAKLTLLKDRFLLEMQELPHLDEALGQTLHETRPAEEAEALERDSAGITLSHRIPEAETILFEGAQGVLLDEWKGFHPYTTWSTVTAEHAWELAEAHDLKDVTVLGLMRAYATRHGEGPFPTFDAEFSSRIEDPGNPVNPWQGAIRSGPLDLMLLRYASLACPVDGLVVSGFDQVPDPIPLCTQYIDQPALDIPKSLKEQANLTRLLETAQPQIEFLPKQEFCQRSEELAPLVITANGPTHADRQWVPNQTILNPPE
jgi:adenylosuccinate synthase